MEVTNTVGAKVGSRLHSRVHPMSERDAIVITGMSGSLPNCDTVEEFEYNLYNKVDMVDDSEVRWNHTSPMMSKRSGKIRNLEKFDATFFGVHHKQAQNMDPQSRILLERAYEAVLDAGVNPKSLRGTRTGVFIGSCISETELTLAYDTSPENAFGLIGCSRAMLANRLSYTLGLKGPSFNLDSACSSSMSALDCAFSAMRSGEIDAALVGGANLALHPAYNLQFAKLGILSKDGYCRPFDNNACGYTRSEAICCLFLQRKGDAKRIYAEVVYSKINCDGLKSEGITYPSREVQAQLLAEFYEDVDISADELGYMEAHATGTRVGDPEECSAIDSVLSSKRSSPLPVGSVKSNIGHTEPTSGICSIIKACLIFQNDVIPPNINFNSVRTDIPALVEGRLKVVTEPTKLAKPYVAINSFGFGGSNAHALLKAHPIEKKQKSTIKESMPRLVLWSGRTEKAVQVVMDKVEKMPMDPEFLALLNEIQREELAGMVFRGFGVFSVADGNASQPNICHNRLVEHFSGKKRPLVWVFCGLGSQWPGMGKELLEIPVFRQSIEESQKILQEFDLDLFHMITCEDINIFKSMIFCFVGITAVQIAQVDVMRALHLEPDYIIGHSVGEIACGYADGCLTRKQALLASYYRGKISGEARTIRGAMAAVGLGYQTILGELPETIDVACHNSADSCTISGPADDILKYIADMENRGIFAREVRCNNIAFHSRYISQMGPEYLRILKTILPEPKKRSEKWISTSVTADKWISSAHSECSAEYYTHNLLNSVLLEEATPRLPSKCITLELGPHGLLQGVLRRSMKNSTHISLVQHGSNNHGAFFMAALGKLFTSGREFSLDTLYPKVEFPVSRGTPHVGSLIRWDHGEDWFVSKFSLDTTNYDGGKEYSISLEDSAYSYIAGHNVGGKIVIPQSTYLTMVWEIFALMSNRPDYVNLPVQFEDISFIRSTAISKGESVNFRVTIHNGNFDVFADSCLIVKGRISEIKHPEPPIIPEYKETNDCPTLDTKHFYTEMKLRGYNYDGVFKGVTHARANGSHGRIEWKDNWAAFLDAMYQVFVLSVDSRSILRPRKIGRLCINYDYHLNEKNNNEPIAMDVFVDRESNRIVCGGIEMENVDFHVEQTPKSDAQPTLEKNVFIPHFPLFELCTSDAVRIALQYVTEQLPMLTNFNIVEVHNSADLGKPLIATFAENVQSSPTITGNFLLLSDENHTDLLDRVQVEKGKIEKQANCTIIITSSLTIEKLESYLTSVQKSLIVDGYVIVRQRKDNDLTNLKVPCNYRLISMMPLKELNETIFLLRPITRTNETAIPPTLEIKEMDMNFTWIDRVKNAMKEDKPMILYSFNEKRNGLIGLVSCLRKETNGEGITCFYIDDQSAPPFNIAHPFYKRQYDQGLPINVYRNGQWGSMRHLLLNVPYEVRPRDDKIVAKVLQPGDLSSLRWMNEQSNKPCRIRSVYASLNFRDVLVASGKLQVEDINNNRLENEYKIGAEFSGVDEKTGKRVMGVMSKGGMSSYQTEEQNFVLDIPEDWSLEQAATVPLAYTTVYYAFFVVVDIRKGCSILIHSGAGGVGLAAIRTAFAYNMDVYTTCGSAKKREFLLKTFPQLKASHIGNSRDTSFESMIRRETKGKGVDFVLNSLAEEKLQASLKCMAQRGHFLEIGKFDLTNDSKIGLKCFLKEVVFHGVSLETLMNKSVDSQDTIKILQKFMTRDIERGIIKPLPATVFPPDQIEKAFRYMANGEHIGKVLTQIRKDAHSSETLPVGVQQRVCFNPDLSYIIPGGLGGFGLELADWMILRGARKLVLSSRRGVTQNYQAYRIGLWKSYGVEVLIHTCDITKKSGCLALIEAAESLGPVGGIFNLAVVIRDGVFMNQSRQAFGASLAPKAVATMHLDELSRKMCPQLEHFVAFSSMSCGRGNAGQTNYGMANSVMERITEDRSAAGYPGKTIQWGAIGLVGVVAETFGDNPDYKVGGTQALSILSCLQQLDVLLCEPSPLVGCILLAEKRSPTKMGLVDTIMQIMAIRDLKSVPMRSSLSEIGMDSLMAVEVKHRLQSDFDIVLTPQDLRSVTLQKLKEYTRRSAVVA